VADSPAIEDPEEQQPLTFVEREVCHSFICEKKKARNSYSHHKKKEEKLIVKNVSFFVIRILPD
jgi:hypothetical protein